MNNRTYEEGYNDGIKKSNFTLGNIRFENLQIGQPAELLDYFAGQVLSSVAINGIGEKQSPEAIAEDCYAIANGMLKERQKYFNNENE